MKRKILSALLTMCMVLTLLPTAVLSADKTSGTIYLTNISWEFDESSGTLTLRGTGKMPDWNYSHGIPWGAYRNDIKHIVVESGITKVGSYAFYLCENVTTVTLSDTIETIKDAAFANCSNLETIEIPASVTDIDVPTAFLNCSRLRNISVSSDNPKYASYGDGALYTKNLDTLLYVPYGLNGTFNVPNGVQEIGHSAFFRNQNISSVNLPSSIINIGHSAFIGTGITKISIPPNVKQIKKETFMHCKNLEEIHISANVKEIEKWAFCENDIIPDIRSIYFYGDAPLLDDDSFEDSSYNIYYPANNLTWDSSININYGGSLTWIPWDTDTGETEKTYTVSYDLDGGNSGPSAEIFAAGSSINLSSIIPVKDGYTFAGWSDGTRTYQAGSSFVIPEKDVVLKAQWTENRPAQPDISDNAEMAYVQSLTQYSLRNADSDTKKSINNALYNLLFKAQYRPTEGCKVNGLTATFTGNLNTNKTWPIQNKDCHRGVRKNCTCSYCKKIVDDQILGKITLAEQTAGCKAYSVFVSTYVYGTSGTALTCGSNIKEFIHNYVDPGEQLWSSRPHAIVFLGESADENGFFYVDYGGGRTRVSGKWKEWHNIKVDYYTYKDFGKKIGSHILTTRDTNGGSYYTGSAKKISDVRNGNKVSRIVARVACPVEATIKLDNEILDSRSPGSASFGSVSRSDYEIEFDVAYNRDYAFNIEGTGDGTMTLTIEYYEDTALVDTRKFVNVPIESDTQIQTSAFDPQSDFVLYTNANDADTWGAGFNETVSQPDSIYSSQYNDTDFSDDVPDTPPAPSEPAHSTGGGGGGGGSSKPSIRPTVQPDTENRKPVTTPDSVTTDFTDVADGAWYAGYVKYVVEKGLFSGVGNGRFDPDGSMTRAMMWTVLARYRGVDTGTGSNWYDAARSWALSQGISDGTLADGNVTREQFVTMLWRMSGEPAVENKSEFPDSSQISGYAKTAVDWAVAQGIVGGYSDGTFRPQGSAARAEVAKMLAVFCEKTN